MNRLTIFAIALVSMVASADTRENLYQTCQEKIRAENFGSQAWENTCTSHFDMPGPYLLKCARWIAEKSFPSEVDRRACRFHCQTNQNWGPWYDFEVDYKSKETVHELKRLHQSNKCFE